MQAIHIILSSLYLVNRSELTKHVSNRSASRTAADEFYRKSIHPLLIHGLSARRCPMSLHFLTGLVKT